MNAALLADAVEALEAGQVPDGEGLRAVLELLQEQCGVGTELRRRRALRKWDELWATGGYATRSAVDGRVAARERVDPVTVRGWRFRRALFPQRAGGDGEQRKGTS